MPNWWVSETGVNMLEGDPDDPENPVKLPDASVIEFIHKIPQARIDLEICFPTLSEVAQTRIKNLISANPFIQKPMESPITKADDFQFRQNTAGVYTAGKFGGTGYRRG